MKLASFSGLFFVITTLLVPQEPSERLPWNLGDVHERYHPSIRAIERREFSQALYASRLQRND